MENQIEGEHMYQFRTRIKIPLANPYHTLGIALLSLTLALSGCGEDPSGGSGFTDVARGEPTIIDSVLANNIFRGQTGRDYKHVLRRIRRSGVFMDLMDEYHGTTYR